jgi:phosphonate transport system permease protein
MLPGVLALMMFSTGFAGKLIAEEIEAIDIGEVEAIHAKGGTHTQIFIYGVVAQIRVALAGISNATPCKSKSSPPQPYYCLSLYRW